MVIAAGAVMRPLAAIEAGANCTWFGAQGDPQVARKRWIAAMKAKGSVAVDAGAARALADGKSLLPAGVVGVEGRFGRGEAVQIRDAGGAVLGQGLVRYTSDEARAIMGKRTDAIAEVLGYPGRAALIHRDDMAI